MTTTIYEKLELPTSAAARGVCDRLAEVFLRMGKVLTVTFNYQGNAYPNNKSVRGELASRINYPSQNL